MRFEQAATRLTLGFSLLVAGERLAHAEDVSAIENLLTESVVSSASKQSEKGSSAPALSSILTAEDLRKYGVRTVAEAIDFLSIAVSSSENLNGGEVGARGVLLTGDHGSHFLVLVDGNVINDPLRGGSSLGSRAGIPLELIDHIEIIVGPGSVLYGSNAMFGLLNIVTKRAKDYSGARVMVESALPISIRAGAGVGKEISVLGQEGEVTAQFEYFEQRGPDLFFGAENTGVDRFTGQPGRNTRTGGPTGLWGGRDAEHSLYVRGPSGVLRAALGNTELDLQGSYYHYGTPTGPGDFDDSAAGTRDTHLSVGLKHRVPVSTVLDLSARGYFSYYYSRNDFIASRGVLCPFGLVTCDYVDTARAHWVGLELQSTWDWFRDNRFTTIVGADARQRHVNSTSETLDVKDDTTLFPKFLGVDHSDVTVAAYAQQAWSPARPIRLTGGARIDSDPRFDPVVTPRLAAIWEAWQGGTLKVAYSSAFRAPSWDETHNATARRIDAEGLKPEKVRSIEGSAQHDFGRHRLLLGGFYSRWDNLVELAPLSDAEAIAAIRAGETTVPFTPGIQLTQYRNTSDVTNYGMNLRLEGAFDSDHVLYGFTLTGATARKRTSDGTSRLPVAPQLFGNARIAIVPGNDIPTVAFATHLVGPRPADLSDGQFSPDPYARTQVEFRLTLSGNVPVIRGLSYRAMANYAVASRGPYVVGPVTSAIATQNRPTLVPVDRFRTTLGLQYEF
ncbi:MAG TPA: TonB-dependent receptor [Polyangiaceae bacterium]|nr:TonB-dependent receptor [Polyangiaceae bacterium]